MKRINRIKLRTQYHNLRKYPITALCAPKGYGKLSFIRQFFHENPELSYTLHDMKQNQYIDSMQYNGYLILYNFTIECGTALLWELKNRTETEKELHVIIISHTELQELILKWSCEDAVCIIGTQNLFFDNQELYELLSLNHFDTKEGTIEKIQNLCGGWILAIILYLNGCGTSGYRFFPNYEMMRMMDSYVYQPLPADMKKLFMRISLLREFTYEELLMQYDGTTSIHFLTLMMEVGFLMHYDKKLRAYRFYDAFRIFLNEELAASNYNIRELHKGIGEYYEQKANYRGMLYHYYHANEYERISCFLNEYEGVSFTQEDPELMSKIYKAIPQSLQWKHPYTFLRMIQDYIIMLHEPYTGERMLCMFAEKVVQSGGTENNEHLMGEILICYGYLQYNDLVLMFDYFKKASVYLNNAVSRLSEPGILIPYGSIFLLYLYHRIAGDLKKLVSFIHEHTACYMKICTHAEAGFELLAEAEYSLETGDYQRAQQVVWQAYYTVCRYKHTSIKIPTLLTLGRLSYLNRDHKTFVFAIRKLEHELEVIRNPVYEKGITCSLLYLRCLNQETVEMPGWLEHVENPHHQEAFYKYIVIGQILIRQQRFVELIAVADILKNVMVHHVFAGIYAELYMTIAALYNEGVTAAVCHYERLLVLCEKDRITAPILECAVILKPLLTRVNQCGYAAYIKQVYEEKNHSEITFTKREYDVMKFIGSGYSIVKTAELLQLKKGTVYSYLKHIYRRIGINCKDELIDYMKENVIIK